MLRERHFSEFRTYELDSLPFIKNGRLFFQPSDTSDINRITFGWSVYNASWEYYMTMQMGVLSKAKELDINVISQDQKSSTIEMITGANELISSGINALVISPYNPEAMPAIAENAKSHHIPVVVIDGGTGGADVAAFIVSDSFGGGILAGEYALLLNKKYALQSKNAAIIKAEKTATYALLRGDGFKSVVQEKGYHIVAEVSANGNKEPAYAEVKRILETYSNNLSVIFCENGLMTLGAAQAINEAGQKGKIILIGFDADPSVLAGIQNGSIQGTIAQQPFKMGELGVEIANSVLHGLPIVYDNWKEKEILMEVYLIDENGKSKAQLI
jgi:ribose transport system substrate-binding protein